MPRSGAAAATRSEAHSISEEVPGQSGSVNILSSYACLGTQSLNSITMSANRCPPQPGPVGTGRRPSMDQGRPTEKPKNSRLRGIGRVFRSNKNDESKGLDLSSDNTSENAPNEINPTSGEELNTKSNTVRTRNYPIPPSC
jgi:hypothetical protein